MSLGKEWIYPSLRTALLLSCLYSLSIQIRFLVLPITIMLQNTELGNLEPVENIPTSGFLDPSQLSRQVAQLDEASRMKITLEAVWAQVVQETQGDKSISSMVLGNFVQRSAHPRGGKQPEPTDDVALVTHGAVKNKMDNLLTQLENWAGPASIAIYIDDGETQIGQLIEFIQTEQEILRFASIHIYMEYYGTQKNPGYPHNLLRNLAMEHSDMDFALAADVDLIPGPPNCYSYMMKSFGAFDSQIPDLMKTNQTLMVVPSFEVIPPDGEKFATKDQLPRSKTELMELVREDKVIPFHSIGYVPGHNATNFPKWYSFHELPRFKIGVPVRKYRRGQPTFYPIQYEENFEPYVVVYKPGLPRYWNRFRGYGFNKRSWMMELHRAGYEFATLTQQYMVHLNHKSLLNDRHRGRNWEEFFGFVDYLNNKYPLEDGHARQSDKSFFEFTVGEKPSLKKSLKKKAAAKTIAEENFAKAALMAANNAAASKSGANKTVANSSENVQR